MEATEGIPPLRCHMPVGWLPGSRKDWWVFRAAGGLTNGQTLHLPPPLSPFLLQAAFSADHQSPQMGLFRPITALGEHGLTRLSGLQEGEVATQDPVSFWPHSQFPRGFSPELTGPPLLLEAERATRCLQRCSSSAHCWLTCVSGIHLWAHSRVLD